VTEVYASTFSPDAIQYRAEHGMIDEHEEMGVLIQEVVGTRVGDYFVPAFSGVAFSHNEFRWSHRIQREDGLLRMVPGLGTRAVDRITDDYPVLLSPRQPNLPVNVSLEEKIRYSPRKIDVVNLKTNAFETIEIRQLLAGCGDQFPLIGKIVSLLDHDSLKRPGGLGIDFNKDHFVVTFDGLFQDTEFLQQIGSALRVLQTETGRPTDLEFAHDGTDLYLLQCRSQSYSETLQPPSIPRNVAEDRILFSANRYVANGSVSGITHIVYVDPAAYAELVKREDLIAVGRAIGKLNAMLPKRRFILMGPGRWGSRGDIKLGVSVTYSDINNTAMLIEIAKKQKGYMPELSFGTHFFQDLVEASIRYLPLYAGDSGTFFKEQLLLSAPNILVRLFPEFEFLTDVIRVIEVAELVSGHTLQILMNADQQQAVAIFTEEPVPVAATVAFEGSAPTKRNDQHWRWRLKRAEDLARHIDAKRFGIKTMYIMGSTKNATAGPQSDIDLLIHFEGSDAQRAEMLAWLEGWSLALSEENYLRTGYKTDGLLDVHVITDEDISRRTSFASKIGSITDAPRPLKLGV
jgi:pyruvate, water dikinase